jgi:hypothetical protein
MSILTAQPPAAKSITLNIRGLAYRVEPIDPGEEGTAAYRVSKQRGEGVYDVVRTHEGLVICDCPSYVCTFEGTAETCKHGMALVQAGLLQAPRPVPTKPAVAPVTPADVKRAAYFGLRIPAPGKAAPVAVEAPAKLAPVVEPLVPVVEVETAPTIEEPRPTHLERFNPSSAMEMEHLGYSLGRQGKDAQPSKGRTFPELVAFFTGLLAGKAALEAEHSDSLDAIAAENERLDEAFGSPESTWSESELIECGSRTSHPNSPC